jgi:hypothetical protein
VAGDFAAADVTEQHLPDEATITPRIFEASGGPLRFRGGKWDGFFAEQSFIDMADPRQGFARSMIFDRTVYAVAYVINTSSRDLRVRFRVTSPNDVELFVGAGRDLGRNGLGTSLTETLPPYATSRQVTRIMVKIFQTIDDPVFGFEMQLSDENGNVITGSMRELVFKLGPEGGV